MDGIQMEPVGKYKTDRNGSAKGKAAWRNMVEQDLDDVAFLAESDKVMSRGGGAPVAVCSQRRALCLAALVLGSMFATALLVVYASPQPDCPCAEDSSLIPGQPPTDDAAAAANKERIATNGAVFPWRGARLPTFVTPKHYSLWLHPNLTTGELRGEVSIDFRVDRDTMFLVLNLRDLNVTERALFKSGGSLGPKVAKVLDYPQADQTYIEFKDKLRRKYNYTLSLRFITKLDRSDKQRGFFLTGNSKHRCAISRFWLTHARSAFPCLDEPHFRATFRLTIVRDRFHVSLTNMPIVATEEAGFYLGHRLLQDEFATSPPMPPHMMSVTVCRLQRRAIPPLPTEAYPETTTIKTTMGKTTIGKMTTPKTTKDKDVVSTETPEEEDFYMPPPEISLYSDQQAILDDAGPFLEWVQQTIHQLSTELSTPYPLSKLDLVVVEGPAWSEGWGLLVLAPGSLQDYMSVARLLAMQWFGGLVSPRWWSSQWLMEALTSVLAEKTAPFPDLPQQRDSLLIDHILPALRLDSSNSVRAVASPRLEKAEIEGAADELALHKGAAIVSMAVEAAGAAAGRAALARLLTDHRYASADARDLWRALSSSGLREGPQVAWDGWCERPGYPLLTALRHGPDVIVTQERFVMTANPPEEDPPMQNYLLTLDLRNELDELFYEPENITDMYDENSTTTVAPLTTRKPVARTSKPVPPPKWVIPLTFSVGPLANWTVDRNDTSTNVTGTRYDFVNETSMNQSRWAENVTHLIWMNDTEMVIPDLGKHEWVRYNVGARGLYRVAPRDRQNGESPESAAKRSVLVYESAGPAERALLLDDAFVLSRAGRLPASRAIAAIVNLRYEVQWAPWRVVLSHISWWRQLLRLSLSGPKLNNVLTTLHPEVHIYSEKEINGHKSTGDHIWLSGALLTAGVEWENDKVTKQALKLFDVWFKTNQTIPEIYQEAALTAGVRVRGYPAWNAVWKALLYNSSGAKPLLRKQALLAALASAKDDWLFYRFAYTVMSQEAQRNHEWKSWVTALCTGACRWRDSSAVWRILQRSPAPPAPALQAAAKCLYQPHDYHMFKKMFGTYRGAAIALDTIALNSAWVSRADADLSAYFANV